MKRAAILVTLAAIALHLLGGAHRPAPNFTPLADGLFR